MNAKYERYVYKVFEVIDTFPTTRKKR